MSDATITGGLVRIEDGLKASEEYAPARKVAVELRFDVAEGSNPETALAKVCLIADSKVHTLLGKAPNVQQAYEADDAARVAAQQARQETAAGEPQTEAPKRRGRPPKTATAPSQPTSSASSVSDPADLPDEPVKANGVLNPADADLAFEAEGDVAIVTDMDLHHAVTHAKSERNITVEQIKNLIRTFHTEEQLKQRWGIASIPPFNRPAFLSALTELRAE